MKECICDMALQCWRITSQEGLLTPAEAPQRPSTASARFPLSAILRLFSQIPSLAQWQLP